MIPLPKNSKQVATYSSESNLLDWRTMENGQLPYAANGLQAVVMDNTVFVTGAPSVTPQPPSIHVWDPAKETWRPADNLTVGRTNHAAIAVSLSALAMQCIPP